MSLDDVALALVCVLGGIALSLASHGILWVGIAQGMIRQRTAVVVALTAIRLMAVAASFWSVARLGAAPPLALLAGFLMGRGIALHRVGGAT